MPSPNLMDPPTPINEHGHHAHRIADTAAAISMFLTSQVGILEWFFLSQPLRQHDLPDPAAPPAAPGSPGRKLDSPRGSLPPLAPLPRMWLVAIPVLLFASIKLLVKLAVMVFFLILVANLAKMFSAARMARREGEETHTEAAGSAEEGESASEASEVAPEARPGAEQHQHHTHLHLHQQPAAFDPAVTIPSQPESEVPLSPVLEAGVGSRSNSESISASIAALQKKESESRVIQDQITCMPIQRPILYVCTKCQFSVNENLPQNAVRDIEDSMLPFESTEHTNTDPSQTKGGVTIVSKKERRDALEKKLAKQREAQDKLPSGTVLYNRILAEIDGTPLESELDIQAVKCLSTCYRSNCIALSGVGKYTYQFGDLDHNDSARDVVEFAEMYVKIHDGYTKTKQRPDRLKETLLARIPPLPIDLSFKCRKF